MEINNNRFPDFEKYSVIKALGQGSFGVTYLVKRKDDGVIILLGDKSMIGKICLEGGQGGRNE